MKNRVKDTILNLITDKEKRKKVAVTLVAAFLLSLLYVFIFRLSGQDGETSGGLSLRISEKCVELVDRLVKNNWNLSFREELALYFEHPIRKLAHFSEYTCMGILVFAMWAPWKKRNFKLYLIVFAWVFLSAVADEFHQTFIPGRYGSFADVVLDSFGGCFGILLSNIFCAAFKDSSS